MCLSVFACFTFIVYYVLLPSVVIDDNGGNSKYSKVLKSQWCFITIGSALATFLHCRFNKISTFFENSLCLHLCI